MADPQRVAVFGLRAVLATTLYDGSEKSSSTTARYASLTSTRGYLPLGSIPEIKLFRRLPCNLSATRRSKFYLIGRICNQSVFAVGCLALVEFGTFREM